jgi:hypothetical protein
MTGRVKYEVTGFVVHRDDRVTYGIKEYTYAESPKKALSNIGYRLKGRVVGKAVEVVEPTPAYEQISLFDSPPDRAGKGGGSPVQSLRG